MVTTILIKRLKKIQITTLIASIILCSIIKVSAQNDTAWSVLLVKKGKTPDYEKALDGIFKNTGFYLYKNCIYDFILKNNRKINGRLIDITRDTLSFTNSFNENSAKKNNKSLDTFKIDYRELAKLNLIADRALSIYEKHALDKFDFIFKKDTTRFYFKSSWSKIYDNDSIEYELVPYLTAQGFDILYENEGRTYYFGGTGMIKPNKSQKDTTYNKKNYIGLTPCKVEEINGLAIGLYNANIKNDEFNERDTLIIRGLSIELNPFYIYVLFNPIINSKILDSIYFNDEKARNEWRVKVNGIHINPITTLSDMRIKGINLTCGTTFIQQINGLTISGLTNYAYITNGVSIASLKNKSSYVKGIQIGLFNKARDLRGLQIGLWNTNGKRSLPFINWQFKPCRKNKIYTT